MKTILLILFSVICLSMGGCGKNEVHSDNTTEVLLSETDKELPKEGVNEAEESLTEANDLTENDISEVASVEDKIESKDTTETQNEELRPDTYSAPDSPATVHESSQQEEQITTQTEPSQSEIQVVSYSPQNVVAIATAKTKAAGKILLTENLDCLLANGQISQEEYNEYYPYDGAGYYSVFVDTNLVEARDVSGTENLNSEEKIAQYISDMIVLENGQFFLIEYAGTYDYYGKICYEFRCYRA